MIIDSKHFDSKKRKRIGKLNGADVYYSLSKGGFNIITANDKIIGAAPHKVIAICIAQRNEPDLFIDELSKSDEQLDFSSYQHLISFWQDFTNKLNK